MHSSFNKGFLSLLDRNSLFPCNSCAKAVIQSGIKKIVYYEDKYADANITMAAKRLFDLVGIEYIQYTKSGNSLTIEI